MSFFMISLNGLRVGRESRAREPWGQLTIVPEWNARLRRRIPRATGPTPRPQSGHRPRLVLVPVSWRRLLNLEQELDVGLVLLELLQEELDRLLLVERAEHPAKRPGDLERVRREQDFLAARPGGVDVDGREDPLVGEVPAELELHVAGALELLEDDLVGL